MLHLRLVNFSSVLIYLLPLALLTGPFFPDLIISIVAIIFIFISFKYKKKKFFQNNFFYIFIIIYIYLIISSIFSTYALFSLKTSLVYIRHGIFAIAIWHLIDENKNFLKIFRNILILTFLVCIFDSYIQYIYNKGMFGFSAENPYRMVLLFNDRQMLGQYLARLMPLVAAMILFDKKININKYLLIGLLFIFSFISVYLSGERTAFVLLFISILFMIFFSSNYKYIRILFLIFSIISIILISVFSPMTKERMFDHTIKQLTLNSNIQLQDGVNTSISNKFNFFSRSHETLLFTALRIFEDNLILGSGPNTYKKICNKSEYFMNNYSCSTHPHNTFIQILSETGILGMMLYFLIICLFLKKIYNHILKKNRLNDYQICLISYFLVSVWPFLPSQDVFNNWISIVYYLPIGFFLHSIYTKKTSSWT